MYMCMYMHMYLPHRSLPHLQKKLFSKELEQMRVGMQPGQRPLPGRACTCPPPGHWRGGMGTWGGTQAEQNEVEPAGGGVLRVLSCARAMEKSFC